MRFNFFDTWQFVGIRFQALKDKAGGLVHQDVDERPVSYEPLESLNEAVFREKIRAGMQHDNAILLLPDGLNQISPASATRSAISSRIS
jgi:hypothetical protein